VPDPGNSARLLRLIQDRIDQLIPVVSREELSSTLKLSESEKKLVWKKAVTHSVARLLAGVYCVNVMVLYVTTQINVLLRYKCLYQLHQLHQIKLNSATLELLPLSEETQNLYINNSQRRFLDNGIKRLFENLLTITAHSLQTWELDLATGPNELFKLLKQVTQQTFQKTNSDFISLFLSNNDNDDCATTLLKDETSYLLKSEIFSNELHKNLEKSIQNVCNKITPKEATPLVKWMVPLKKALEPLLSETSLQTSFEESFSFGQAIFLEF